MKNKEPWGEGTPWKNSTAFFTYLRGCLRKAWSRNPVKLEVIKKAKRRIPNPNPKSATRYPTTFGADCTVCGGTFTMREIECDHIIPVGKLTKREDLQGFIERLLYLREEDLRVVCKGCNATMAYADRYNITYDEARVIKKAIHLEKTKKDKEFLTNVGITPGSNQKKRREQIIEYLKTERANDE